MKKITPERVRMQNTRLVLRTIYEHGPVSRAEVSRLTRLARPTVSNVVADLLADGLVAEVGRAPSRGGKRATWLSVVDKARTVIGLDLGREDFRGAVLDLRGRVVQSRTLSRVPSDGATALQRVYGLVDDLLAHADHPLLGIAIGTPGLVDADQGIVRQAVNLDWRDVPLGDLLSERYAAPAYVTNDAQAAAFGEYIFGNSQGNGDLVVISVGWGVGAGVVVRGQLLTGNPYGAGEIGHVRVVEDGVRCQCGQVGCLETEINTRAIVRKVRNELGASESLTFGEVRELFNAGHKGVHEVIHEVGDLIGMVAAMITSILGGCRVLLAGRITCFGDELLDAVRDSISRRVMPALAERTTVGFSTLGSDSVLQGAAALLLHHELSLFSSSAE